MQVGKGVRTKIIIASSGNIYRKRPISTMLHMITWIMLNNWIKRFDLCQWFRSMCATFFGSNRFFVKFGAGYPELESTTFRLNSSNPALPYISLFLFFNLFTWLSTTPLLQGYLMAFFTASKSWLIPFIKLLILIILVDLYFSSHWSNLSSLDLQT